MRWSLEVHVRGEIVRAVPDEAAGPLKRAPEGALSELQVLEKDLHDAAHVEMKRLLACGSLVVPQDVRVELEIFPPMEIVNPGPGGSDE